MKTFKQRILNTSPLQRRRFRIPSVTLVLASTLLGLSACFTSGGLRVEVSRYQGDLILSEHARLDRAETIAITAGSRLADSIEQAVSLDHVLRRRQELLGGLRFESRWIGDTKELAIIKEHRAKLHHICQLAISVFEDRLSEYAERKAPGSSRKFLETFRKLPVASKRGETSQVLIAELERRLNEKGGASNASVGCCPPLRKAKAAPRSNQIRQNEIDRAAINSVISQLTSIKKQTSEDLDSGIGEFRVSSGIGQFRAQELFGSSWEGQQEPGDGQSLSGASSDQEEGFVSVESLLQILRSTLSTSSNCGIGQVGNERNLEKNRRLLRTSEQLHAVQRAIEEVCPEAATVLKWQVRQREYLAIDDSNRRRRELGDSTNFEEQEQFYSSFEIRQCLADAHDAFESTYANGFYSKDAADRSRPKSGAYCHCTLKVRVAEKEVIFGDHFFSSFLKPLWTNLSQSYPHIAGLANFHEKVNRGRREPSLPSDGQLWSRFEEALTEVIKEGADGLKETEDKIGYWAYDNCAATLKQLKKLHEADASKGASRFWTKMVIAYLVVRIESKRNSEVFRSYFKEKAAHQSRVAELNRLRERGALPSSLIGERNLQWGIVVEAQTKLLKKYLSVVGDSATSVERDGRMTQLLKELNQLSELENPYVNITTTGAYLGLENFQDAIARQDRPGLMLSDDWQIVSVVTASAAARADYVIMRDHLGNWQIKSASNDPTELINAASNGVLAAGELIASGSSASKQFNEKFSAFAKEHREETAGVQGLVGLVESLTVERETLMKSIGETKESLTKAQEAKGEDAAALLKKAEEAHDAALKKAKADLPEIKRLLEQIDKTLTSDLKTQA